MPLSTSEEALYDLIKGALTMTGGAIGGGSGFLGGAGLGAIPGAVVGAGLGGGMGESIKNYAKANQGIPVNLEDILKAIPGGAAAELGGQALGKGLGYVAKKVIDKAAPTSRAVQELISSLKKSPSGKLETVYHGGTEAIPNPVAKSNFSLGGQVFHTTPEQYVADQFAYLRSHRDAPSFEEAAKVPGIVNEYYQKIVPELHLNYNSAPEIARRLGLTLPQAEEAMSAALPRGEYRLWPEILKQRAQEPSFVVPDEIQEIGQQAVDILKSQGIRRLSKEADIGPEIYNFYPEEDLFHGPTWNKKLSQEQGMNDLNRLGKEAAQKIIDSFSTSLANTPRSK